MNWNKAKFAKLIRNLKGVFKEKDNEQRYIYYENILRSRELPHELTFILNAKGIADHYKGKIIGIMPYHIQNDTLLQAVGGELDDIRQPPSLLENLEIYARLFALLISCHTGSDVAKIQCRKVLLGDLIYCDIVRKHSDIYTLKKANILKYWDTYKKIITLTVVYDRKFVKQPPYMYIVNELMYKEATLYRLSAKHGAKIIKQLRSSEPILFSNFGRGYEYNFDKLFYEDICRRIQKNASTSNIEIDINSLIYGGESKENKAAFGIDKPILEREEALRSLGVNQKKKNVVIFLHCFSDNCYKGNDSIYNDYYCWYIDTIIKVKNINKVNWIFREHPMAAAYGESDVAKKIFDEHKNENIYWMSKEYNGKNIPLIADAVITVAGTAGVEYSALGIPCVILGKPFYSHFGYTINVKSEREYLDVLNKMDRIHMLSNEKTIIAKKILRIYIEECRGVQNTEIDDFISQFYNTIHENKRIPCSKAESDFLDRMLEWLKRNDIKDSRFYKFGSTLP